MTQKNSMIPLLGPTPRPPQWSAGRLQLCVAGRDFALRREDDMEALWERIGQDAFGCDEHMPYWAEIWPASLLLAAWLGARRTEIAGRRCLDLGCGMGLSSLAGAAFGGLVTAVDYEEAAIAHAWRDMVDLARRVQNWRFAPTQRRALEFYVANALENLGESDRAKQIWTKLAGDQSLEAEKRCYAMYFMAKESVAKKDLEKAELYAGEAAFMFRETGKDPDKLKASLNILVEATRGLGQFPKALKWANDYAALCKQGDDDWGANRLRIAALQRAMASLISPTSL